MDKKGLSEKRNTISLSESESKKVLAQYGVPVVSEKIAENEDAAVKAAEETGFPVVLKGLGSTLLHKTERGLVHLNLTDPVMVKAAAASIIEEAGEELEGILVQPYLEGKREFVAGFFRDKLFGPVVMFGLGGVFTEALSDVSFRLAPVEKADVAEMLTEISSKALLGNFRGECKADHDQLIQVITGLSRIGIERPEIDEIDINPLLITPTGKVCAVDALIVENRAESVKEEPLHYIKPEDIGSLFYPKSIAFVGASSGIFKWGHSLLTNTLGGNYEGKVYRVNPRGGVVAGGKAYKSIADIPGEVDLGVVTIPEAYVMDLIPQFKAKGIKKVVLVTSGFGETGEDGKKREKELVNKAREAGILVLGPNTMGISNPHIKLNCTSFPIRPEPGHTSIIAQSGNMGVQFMAFAKQQGIGIRAFCGSGNEAMITIEDYLAGFEVDPMTKTVMMYVESVKNGRRFFESARRVGKKKPILLLKGGESEEGIKAAASHTGALTSDSRVFDAVCKQAGIVKAKQSTDLLDFAASFSSLPLPKGNRIAVITMGGGWGVVTADLCAYYGLKVPELSEDLIGKIDKMLPPYWSRGNPVDLVAENEPAIMIKLLEELMKWDGCDAVIHLGVLGRIYALEHYEASITKIDDNYDHAFFTDLKKGFKEFEENYMRLMIGLMEKYEKPVIGVRMLDEGTEKTIFKVKESNYASVNFTAPERAVKSLAKMYEYHSFLKR
jgi:acyl-CoA synthetase (NDP forming)